MVCNNCGYDSADGSNTCANCGYYMGENPSPYSQPYHYQSNPHQPNQWQQHQQYSQQAYYGQSLDDPTPLTTKQYVGMIFLQAVPIVGLIMLLVWAFSSPGNINRRNYARGSLIVTAIIIGIYVAILLLVFTIGLGMRNSFYY